MRHFDHITTSESVKFEIANKIYVNYFFKATIFFKMFFQAVVQGLFLKEGICSHREKIFPFMNSPMLIGTKI